MVKCHSYIISDTHGANVGLAITQTILLTGKVQWGIRQFALLENEMMSVERILEYVNSPQEAPLQSPLGNFNYIV